ncbi:hypothetical protein L1987_56407 [Smallanthus sonchifolius]|uniref:Uncharacterized protein n=1 Tax=Smallanthus sonchifolius TaxID=185202 RepID=A0ACB9ECK6_9ASTR|nr:hypothetical protein L1987_56407 [Smallanthus sonchifolius]
MKPPALAHLVLLQLVSTALEPVDNIIDIHLTQTGEGIAECELLKWFVKEGDEVEEYQPLCEVQSDKATIEITSRYQGKVVQFLHVPGDIVKETNNKVPLDVGEPSPTSHPIEPSNESSELRNTQEGETLTTPAVRNLAKQHGIDLNDVPGTGKHGRVQKEDILNYVASVKNKPALVNPASVKPTLEPEQIIRPMAEESLYDIAHKITKELARLQKLAKENKLNPEDIHGGTITLSNIGAIGGKSGSPIINAPEVAIIALGRAQKVACFGDDGKVYPVSLMTANIAADHRILDGATVA